MDVTPDIFQKAQQVKLLAMDVDGVLTQGEVIYLEDGDAVREVKTFNVKDGHGLAMLVHAGFQVALITGRNSVITRHRASELGIQHVFQGVKTKLPVLEKLLGELNLDLSQVLYMGDDTPDIPILRAVGFAVCPSDAVDEVKRVCHYTTKAPGGRGAVREMTDLLMRVQLSQETQVSLGKNVLQA